MFRFLSHRCKPRHPQLTPHAVVFMVICNTVQ